MYFENLKLNIYTLFTHINVILRILISHTRFKYKIEVSYEIFGILRVHVLKSARMNA